MAKRKYSRKSNRLINRYDDAGTLNHGSSSLTGSSKQSLADTLLKSPNLSTKLGGAAAHVPHVSSGSTAGNSSSSSSGSSSSNINTNNTSNTTSDGSSIFGLSSDNLGALSGAVGTAGYSILSDGLDSKAGSTINSIGSTAGNIVSMIPGGQVIGAAIKAGSGVVGGLTNKLFGANLNTEKIDSIKSNNNSLNTLNIGEGDTNYLANSWNSINFGSDFSKKNIGRDGIFSNKASNTYKRLRNQQNVARSNASLLFNNAVNNSDYNNDLNMMANYSAYGGPLGGYGYNNSAVGYDLSMQQLANQRLNTLNQSKLTSMPNSFGATNTSNTLSNGGSIYINPANRGKFNATKKATGKSTEELTHSKNALTRRRAIFAQNAAKWNHKKAFGGDLSVNGGDFPTGLLNIGTGGTHEQNPNEGVQMGVDNQGVPNLVEQDEVVYNDYVYSNRLKATKDSLKAGQLPDKYIGKSFSDIAELLGRESEERPNDPISQAGLKDNMDRLQTSQEDLKQTKQLNQFRRLPKEQQLAIMQQGQQMQQAQQAQQGNPQEQQGLQVPQEYMQSDNREPQFGFGGNLFLGGGNKKKLHFTSSDFMRNTDRNMFMTPEEKAAYYNGNNYNVVDWNNVNPAFDNSINVGYVPYYSNKSVNDVQNMENSSNYQAFTNYILNNDNDYTRAYINNLNNKLGNNMLLDSKGNRVSNFNTLYNNLRNDHKQGYAHLTPSFSEKSAFPKINVFKDDAGNIYWDKNSAAQAGYDISKDIANTTDKANETKLIMGNITNLSNPEGRAGIIEDNIKYNNNNSKEEDEPYTQDLEPTWMRYAPVVGSALGVFSDAMGWTNKPDYTNADIIANSVNHLSNVSATPVGNYLQYNPFDRDYYINKLNAQAGATRRGVVNASNGNRATATAGILAADYNAQNQLGDLARQAEEYNLKQREDVGTFNRGTNEFNSESSLKAQMANKQNDELRVNAALQSAKLRDDIFNRASAGRSANLTNLFNNMGNIGRENYARNMITANRALMYAPTANGGQTYKAKAEALKKQANAYLKAKNKSKKSNGGYLTINNKRGRKQA
jgi:hypothetical protein